MGDPSLATLAAAPQLLLDKRVRTPWSEFWRKFKQQKVAMVAGAFVVLLVVVAIAAPWIVPFDAETYFDYDALNARPSLTHWFGVDALGRDIFSRILMGTSISLTAGFLPIAAGKIIRPVLVLSSAHMDGCMISLLMRICH